MTNGTLNVKMDILEIKQAKAKLQSNKQEM